MRAPDLMPPIRRAAPRPGAPGRVPLRPLGREPRRRLPDREGLSHRGAALEQPGRRDRYRGAAARHAGVRRGEGARAARRCGRGRDRAAAAPHHRGGAKPGSPRHPDDVNSDIRFDVVLVAPKSLPRHIMAAFDASN